MILYRIYLLAPAKTVETKYRAKIVFEYSLGINAMDTQETPIIKWAIDKAYLLPI